MWNKAEATNYLPPVLISISSFNWYTLIQSISGVGVSIILRSSIQFIGALFLLGMLIMGYNVWKTVAAGPDLQDSNNAAQTAWGDEPMKHEIIEKNIGLMIVLVVVAISFGGLAEIVPLMYQKDTGSHSAE